MNLTHQLIVLVVAKANVYINSPVSISNTWLNNPGIHQFTLSFMDTM
ncbi:hypothetical protein [Mucilaginibacter sp. SJ]|nr:hypothetical protein [Mucilaginibacter sp. SJ]WEA02072.1 hypothetical protein MusilaSJ_03930 [Mucilaginibacter sp. SJ]